jgi:hypothetical protein
MQKLFFILTGLLFVITINSNAKDYMFEERLLNGHEQLYDAGLDTTYNWWAITQPFSHKYRLHINGAESEVFDYVSVPLFSPSGERWATFADANGTKYVLSSDSAIYIPGEKFGTLRYSGDSEILLYSYLEGTLETIIYGDKKIEVLNRTGKIFIDYFGEHFAFVGQRGSYFVLNIDGEETTQYEEILPIGFWHTGEFLYAAKNGYSWEIYKGNKSIGDTYTSVIDGKINLRGDVAGLLVASTGNRVFSLLISDDYYEPLNSPSYEVGGELALHPYLPLVAFTAKYNHKYLVVYNSTEFAGNDETTAPQFTTNGEELVFFSGGVNNAYIHVDGKRTKLVYGANFANHFVKAPGSDTYAFTNSSNLIMNFISRKSTHTGWMVDRTGKTRYNRFDDTYEALGIIRDKLYLLIAKVPR